MSKPSAKKLAKKKEREREVRQKVLRRREALRAKERENRRWEEEERAAETKPQPIRNADLRREQTMRKHEVERTLKRNLELLKGLLEEYEQSKKDTPTDPQEISVVTAAK